MRVRKERIVIIGNGIAGTTAMEVIRRKKPSVHLALLSDEPFPAYSACVLAYYVAGELERKRTFIKSMRDYRGVDARLGRAVMEIDLKNRTVNVGEEKLPFDKLVLATGGEAVIPGIEGVHGPGVFALKTLRDADDLARIEAKSAVIVGSGPTGIEAAIALKKRGLQVSLVELMNSILPAVLDKEAGARIESMLRAHGIHVVTGQKATRVMRSQDKVQAIETDGGKIPCEMVVFAVGVRPRVQPARIAGIATGISGGIRVNGRMETNHPGVYACGDCAEFVDPADGTSGLQLFWFNARQMGRVAGAGCAGIEESYALIQPGTVLDVFGTTVGSVGATSGTAGDGVRIVEREAGNLYSRFIFKGDSLVGAQFMGRLEDAGPIAALIRNGCPAERLPERLLSYPVSYKYHRLVEGWG
jgi:NADH oxidase (H2O2-forming)